MKSHWILALGAALCIAAPTLVAQLPPDSLGDFRTMRMAPIIYLGSIAEDRARLNQLRGAATDGWLLRSPSTLATALAGPSLRIGRGRGCNLRWSVVSPATDLTWNSLIPFERNDGGVWEGRGSTVHVTAGIQSECGRLRVLLVPEFSYSQNRVFPILTAMQSRLSGFANPFYSGREASADLPLRFGSAPIAVFGPGQSAVELDVSPVTLGFGAQSQWWGPGIRNGLVMSNHAVGIPSFYVRTARPLRSRLGAAEARWIVGALTESPYYDFDPTNNLRSLSGLVVTFKPAVDSALTLGGARVVYAPIGGVGALPARFLDAVGRWGEGGDVRASTYGRAADQLITLFGRWVFPNDGLEAYGEWARRLLPTSIRELLVEPQRSQGYTIGMQWISAVDPRRTTWRLQTEVSMLEQMRVSRADAPQSFYISPVIAQGYTQRGRTIGAAIGPGGNSQFIAIDRLRPSWSVGGMAGRVHWNGEEYFRQLTGFSVFGHDVSVFAGLRAARSLGGFEISSELVTEKRMNYLFQSAVYGYSEDHTFDMISTSLRFAVTPR